MSTENDVQNTISAGEETFNDFQQLNVHDNERPEGEAGERSEEEYGQTQLTLRAIVSTKEAGVIIGKAGKNVADLREETGVKAGVSKVVPNVHDRVLSVTGTLDGVSRAYGMVAQTLLDSPPSTMGGGNPPSGAHPIRLLISHNQMGTIIGRQGLKIKHIQDVSGVRMVAQKDMLPQSTERIVEVTGGSEGIRAAVWEIGKCLIDDYQRGTGTVLYNPTRNLGSNGGDSRGSSERNRSYARTGNGADFYEGPPRGFRERRSPSAAAGDENMQTQNISIPADMVGCIIGKAGAKISEIRKSSGAKISIAKAPHDDTGERMFTIMGTAQSNEKALYLLYENLEAEKARRLQAQE
ncbi:hypothetical protein BGX38DRAFT_1138824 [Terfezia claveryi]|nr:hypothetical protein BGX38DRAFT_1138824 [Terfezia claveryi]